MHTVELDDTMPHGLWMLRLAQPSEFSDMKELSAYRTLNSMLDHPPFQMFFPQGMRTMTSASSGERTEKA
ncbi:hypothetical protein VTO42DRAFT_4762 [Malbranchea cinnamomea]